MWRYSEERRSELQELVDAGKKACEINPSDILKKKELAHTLVGLASCFGASNDEDIRLLHESILVWEEVLDMVPQDYGSRYEMGFVYYRMLIINPEWPGQRVDYDAKIDICEKAIGCFERIREEAPEDFRYYAGLKASEDYEDFYTLQEIKNKAQFYRVLKLNEAAEPAKSASPECMEDFEMGSAEIAFDMTRVAVYPDNAEIWKKRGIDLMNLAFRESGIKKRETITDAIAKLKNALLINPNDVEAKDVLLESYNQLLSDHCLFEDGSGEPTSSIKNSNVAELKTNIKRRRDVC